MKLAALLFGVLASTFAWAAGVWLTDISAEFLELWPRTNSMQLLGLASWHAIVAAALVGGLLAVVSPWSGGVLLLAAAGWAALGATLPVGFAPQIIVPLVLSAGGGLAALGAGVRSAVRQRRAANRMSLEDLAREEALRLDPVEPVERVDPHEDLLRALSARAVAGREEPARPTDSDGAIRLVPAAPPRDVPRGVPALMVLNVAALVVLTAAVGLLLYISVRNGHFASAFGIGAGDAAVAAALETTAALPAEAEKDGAGSAKAETEAVVAAASVPVAAASVPVAAASVPVASVPVAAEPAAASALEVAAEAPSEWSDPFAYCAAVGTVDYPDRRYVGPMLPAAIAQALNAPPSSPPDRVHWRCADGAVLGCLSFRGPTCALTPTVAEMMEFCVRHPDAEGMLAPNGTWSCNGQVPVVPPGASWPVDARGFLPGAWVAILPPVETPSG